MYKSAGKQFLLVLLTSRESRLCSESGFAPDDVCVSELRVQIINTSCAKFTALRLADAFKHGNLKKKKTADRKYGPKKQTTFSSSLSSGI